MKKFINRNKYTLNTESLVFEKDRSSAKLVILTILKYVSVGSILGLTFWFFSMTGFISSPKNRLFEKSNSKLISEVVVLTAKFDTISSFLNKTQNKDDNFYRVISHINPIPVSIRKAGFGGTNKYSNLEGYTFSNLLINASKKSDILLNQLHIQSKSFDTIIYLAKNLNDSLLSAPGIAPVAPNDYLTISSGFGLRIHPITKRLQGHDGIDFAANIGNPIRSTGNGIVTTADKNSNGYGNYVVINHGYGFTTLYAHMSKLYVKKGDTIQRGQIIGAIGNTGSSTGPHLHYEVIVNGAKKNPINFYIDDLSDEEYSEMTQLFSSNN